MKEISVTLWELTKEEAASRKSGQILVYNPIMGHNRIDDCASKNCIARNKHAIKELKYFSFNEEDN